MRKKGDGIRQDRKGSNDIHRGSIGFGGAKKDGRHGKDKTGLIIYDVILWNQYCVKCKYLNWWI